MGDKDWEERIARLEKFSENGKLIYAKPNVSRMIGEMRELWTELQAARANACPPAKVPEWIKCSERLPPENQDVLIWPINWHLGDEPCYAAHLSGGAWKYIWAGSVYQVYRTQVTHWMPRPAPPQTEGAGDE